MFNKQLETNNSNMNKFSRLYSNKKVRHTFPHVRGRCFLLSTIKIKGRCLSNIFEVSY